MSEITSIEPQKKDKERCNIYIDGRFYCGIKLEVALKYRLKVGMEIDANRLDEIQLETEKSQALDRAMTHLSATMKTESEMRRFLSGKGYTEAVIEYVMEKLRYYKFVDDYAYCRLYLSGAFGKGKRAIESELIKRGADRAAIEEALENYEEDADAAAAVLGKYLRGKPLDGRQTARGQRYLLSKGYSYDTIKSAIEKLGGDYEDN